MACVDVHQHVWPRQFVAALRRRADGVRLDGWELHLPGEPTYRVAPADHDVALRADLAAADGIDSAWVSLSSPLGIEHLPFGDAQPLLDAYHEGALALPKPFRVWAAASVTAPDPVGLAALLGAGCVGLQLPATALADRDGYTRCGALLEVLQQRGRPLFLHPGPAASPDMPPWWPAVVPYVAQMHTAWFAWQAFGVTMFPQLKVVFSLLAGLAPLHAERSSARGGPVAAPDSRVFLETSSYGPQAVLATARQVGGAALLLGSDRPYAAPVSLGVEWDHALRVDNPARLLG
jgi:hypothetical protein